MAERACGSCGGTGWWWLNRSWFKTDGYRRERCHICGGTGRSDYRDSTEFVRRQAQLRRELATRPAGDGDAR